METPITHITKIEIEKLWGLDDWNLSWELNPDVNILAGDNGSGKSTVLKTIIACLKNEASLFKSKNTESIKLSFDNNKVVSIQKITIITHANKPSGVNEELVYQGTKPSITIDYISTFNQKLKSLETIQKLAGTGVETDLDWELYQLQDKYKDYKIEIGERAIKVLEEGSKNTQNINQKINLFWDLVDTLFAKTGKKIAKKEKNLSFLFRNNEVLTAYDLSAGEKQMLIILLTALVQDNQPAIMIMDEPELSLHTDWQKDLIDNIRRLNENVQLIIATHSPAVIMKGWASPKYVFQIEDLKTKETHELVRTN